MWRAGHFREHASVWASWSEDGRGWGLEAWDRAQEASHRPAWRMGSQGGMLSCQWCGHVCYLGRSVDDLRGTGRVAGLSLHASK